VVNTEGEVSTRSGHFENLSEARLVSEDKQLRLRITSPKVSLNLRFEYFNREKAAYVPLPSGTKLEVWKDSAGETSPLVTGRVGQNGSAELSVPKGSEDKLDLYVRVVMQIELDSGTQLPAEAEVYSGASVITWETRGKTATDGTTAGLFNDVKTKFPTSDDVVTFQIGTGAADATVEHAAPFILSVISDVHTWLRTRVPNSFHGASWLRVNLANTAGEGSKFQQTVLPSVIHLNAGNQAHDSQQLDTGNPQNDHWNRLIIAHQYGHVVYERFFIWTGSTEVSVPNHRNFDTENELGNNLTARRRAFAEGFADFIAFRHLRQKVRPKADISSGGWSAQGAANLNAVLGGDTANDTTLIRSAIAPDATTNLANATCEVSLTALIDPRTNAADVPFQPLRASGYVIRFRYRMRGASQVIDLTAKVMDNATERASWSLHAASSEWVTAAYTLTPAQADSITNYGNLRLRFIATGGSGANRQIEISWIEMEAPHPARPDRDRQQLSWRGSDNRRVFESNGMVFTRAQISNQIAGAAARVSQEHTAAVPPTAQVWGFQARPADQARLNIAEMGQITAYRIEAAPAGTTNFVKPGRAPRCKSVITISE